MHPLRRSRRSVCAALALAGCGIVGSASNAERAGDTSRIDAIVFDALGTLFDTSAIGTALERVLPGQGGKLADVWRLKQLEYTWLSASAQRYVPLGEITRRSLDYATAAIGVTLREDQIAALLASYGRLPCFPDVRLALAALRGRRLAILSASGPALLESLLLANGLRDAITTVISTEAAKTYKPSPQAYALAQRTLDVPPANILLVSSNGFDAWGAATFGFQTAWLQRPAGAAAPGIYELLRAGPEMLRPSPAHVLRSLAQLPRLLNDGRPID